MSRTQAGQVTCRAILELGSKQVTGEAAGFASATGDVRLGAQAAMAALERFTERALSFELLGVRVVRAFDANVVIISLIASSDNNREKLLGCYLTDGDVARGAALAVLNATNRIVSPFLLSR